MRAFAAVGCAAWALGCGSADGTFPRERAAVRLVRCVAAQPLPTMASELFVSSRDRYGELVGIGGGGRGTGGFGVQPKVRITVTEVTIETGTFDPAVVKKALTARLPDLQNCYARDTASAALKAKSVKLQFTVTASGAVTMIREIVDGRISQPTCVRSVLSGLVFSTTPRVGSSLVTVAVRFNTPAESSKPGPGDADPWTPFALDTQPPNDSVQLVARAAESAMRKKLGALQSCFQPTSPTGSLRLMLDLDEEGKLVDSRAGGLGDKAIEECVRTATMGLEVVSPLSAPAEIACDLSRGDAEAWRVTPDAGYEVIAAGRAKLTHANHTLAAGDTPPDPLSGDATYLVLADPDATGSIVSLALSWAYEADATLVAIRDPKSKQPPRYLGMGLTSAASGEDDEGEGGILPALRLGAKTVTACVNRTTQTAKLSEPSLVSALLQNVANKCKTVECSRTLVVAIDPDAVARDLLEVTGAARRAGFDRVLVGGELCGGSLPATPDEIDLDEDEL